MSNVPSVFSSIRPRTILLLTALLAAVMIGSAVLELSQSREELMHILTEEAMSLAESVRHTAANVVLSTDEIERQITQRLLDNASFLAAMDRRGTLTPRILAEVCERNNIFRINLFDRTGRRVLSSHDHLPDHPTSPERARPEDILRPLLSGEADTLIIGLTDARYEEGQRYAVALRRSIPEGGAIVLNVDAAEFTTLRQTLGIGRMMKDIGDNSGIEYALLQDNQGIIAAGGTVSEIASIESDPFLQRAEETDTTHTRVIMTAGHELFEVVQPLSIGDEYLGLLRIGLSMDEVRATETRMQRRMIILSLVVLAISGLVALAIVSMQRLRKIESFTGTILEQMNDAVVTIDHLRRVTIFNSQAARLLHTSETDVRAKNLDDPGWPFDLLRSLVDSGPEITECEPLWPDGTHRSLSVSRSNNVQPDGATEHITLVIRDITESRRLERELRRRDRLSAMGELAAGVAHEIRNPLNAIAMISQRFMKEFKPVRGVREYRSIAKVLLDESRRVNGIIHQFLRFARPAVPIIDDVPLAPFLGHINVLALEHVRDKRIRLTMDSAVGTARFDREQMTQALLNLLRNAVEAVPEDGWISLTTVRTASQITFAITDSGPGIPVEQRERVFEPSYSSKSTGTGLGLAITRQIVEAHGGTIGIEGEHGSTFRILLPQ